MITLPRLRKRSLSNGLVPVLDWAAIFTIMLERGWIWMTASVRRRFPPYLTGQLLRAGDKTCGHGKGDSPNSDPLANAKLDTGRGSAAPRSLILQIEALAEPLGKRMYRGLLKRIARVWNRREIQDAGLQRQVLAQMQAAERGFRRLDAALERVEPETLTQILRYLNLQSLTQVDNLQTLHQVVLALEGTAQRTTMKR
jgi:hypothetical protein